MTEDGRPYPDMPPPRDVPADPTGLRWVWQQTWFRVAVIAGGIPLAIFLFLAALVNVFFNSLDHAGLSDDEVDSLRPACGIAGAAFADPIAMEGSGSQERTYSYGYADRTAAWVDANVLPRFGETTPADDLLELEVAPGNRTSDHVLFDQPYLTSSTGSPLVWSSTFGESDMGSTTFDVYRQPDGRYEVLVECTNSSGINGSQTAAAVPTTAP